MINNWKQGLLLIPQKLTNLILNDKNTSILHHKWIKYHSSKRDSNGQIRSPMSCKLSMLALAVAPQLRSFENKNMHYRFSYLVGTHIQGNFRKGIHCEKTYRTMRWSQARQCTILYISVVHDQKEQHPCTLSLQYTHCQLISRWYSINDIINILNST